MLLEERPYRASVAAGASALVVSDQSWPLLAVPVVVGPSEVAVRHTVSALHEPVEYLADIPVRAIVLPKFSDDEWVLLCYGVQSLLPARQVVAIVEVVEVSACGEIVLRVVR